MRQKITPATWAALTYALAAIMPIGIWLIMLFYAMPANQSIVEGAYSTISYLFSFKNENHWWFVGLAVLPICLITLSVFYFSPLSLRRGWARGLFAAALIVTTYSLVFVPIMGLCLVLQLYFSYRGMHAAPLTANE